MLFDKQIGLLSDSLDFGFLDLFNGISFAIFFASCLEDFREISRSQVDKFSELVQAVE